MATETAARNINSDILKDNAISAIEFMQDKILAQEKYIKELENVISKAETDKKFWSASGLMSAKQVSEYLGYKTNRVYELGNQGTFKMGKDGKRVIFFKSDIIAYKRKLEADAGLIPQLKII